MCHLEEGPNLPLVWDWPSCPTSSSHLLSKECHRIGNQLRASSQAYGGGSSPESAKMGGGCTLSTSRGGGDGLSAANSGGRTADAATGCVLALCSDLRDASQQWASV